MSASDREFGYGRVSNASIETYFRTVKSSVLEKRTNLRPTDFLICNYKHTLSRFKADQFGVAQSSRGRKKRHAQSDDLNAEDEWGPHGRPNANADGRTCFFNKKISQTNAYKLS